MFSLKPSDAQAALDEQLRALGAERIRPQGLAAERTRRIPVGLAADLDGIGRLMRGKAELRDPLSSVIALEALSSGDPGVAYALLPAFQLSHLIDACGSDEQKKRFLPRAEAIWSTASSLLLYEDYGRGPAEMETRATRAGDGWSLTGRKIAVHHPGSAGISVLVARAAGDDQLAAFAFEGMPPGLTAESDSWQTGTLGAGVTPTGAVRLQKVSCAEEDRLGASNEELRRAVACARLMLSAVQLGAAAAAAEYAGSWAREREAFGRKLTSFQGVSFVLVDCDTKVESARLELWETVGRVAGASDVHDLDRMVRRAVRRCADTATEVTREGIQLLGVHGIVVEHPVERFWRTASALSLIDFDPLDTTLSLV